MERLSVWIQLGYIIFATYTVMSLPPPISNDVISGRPSGHCNPICTCQMDGLYYSEGERWTKPENPCTVYRCTKDGFFEIEEQLCSFKGECKPLNSTWRESCNTFKCVSVSGSVHYTLQEAGCRDDEGQCHAVGERIVHVCDVIECQLDGGALKMNTVQTGCSVDGKCIRQDAFWHDGCTVHKCDVTGEQAVHTVTPKGVMIWPDGQYALLKPKTGCPTDLPAAWQEGNRKHFGAGANVFPVETFLAGNYTKEFADHAFCVHGLSAAASIVPRYKTYWEPGSYCILRSGGYCPRGFKDGYIRIHDLDTKYDITTSVGQLPDGDFSSDTGFYFCCRGDGPVLSDITLPKEDGFVIFPKQGSPECQNVKGLTSTKLSLMFNGGVASTHESTSSGPATETVGEDLTLLYCVYKPIECGPVATGCKDNVTGELIPLDTEKELNCVLKRCSKMQGVNTLEVVSGGCKAEGKCVAEDNMTSVFTGESCTKRICKRQTNTSEVAFVMEDFGKGCRDGEACKDIGSEIARGCYTSQCMVDGNTNEPGFKVTSAACPWLESCMPPNSTWSYNCMSYRCDIRKEAGNHQWNVVPIEYGCGDGRGNCFKVGERLKGTCYEAVCSLNENKTQVSLDVLKGDCEWNDGCYQPNQTWTDGCITYQCYVTRTENGVNWDVKTLSVGCRDFKGSCVPEGEVINEKCVDYMCTKSGNRIGLQAVSVGCAWGEGCKPENSTWAEDERCVQYQCLKKETPNGPVMEINVAGYGCVFNNTCKEVNATWADGCRTRKCVVKITNNMIQRSIEPITSGCDDQGICRPIGYKKVTDSCAEYECQFNETYKDAFFTLSSGACKAYNGECKKVGEMWSEKRNDACFKFECQKVSLGYISRMTEQSCLDADGVCQPIGSTGFPAMVNDKRQSNCRCGQSSTNLDALAIRCGVP